MVLASYLMFIMRMTPRERLNGPHKYSNVMINELIESGKQIGQEFLFELNGKRCLKTIAIQRIEKKYKVYYRIMCEEDYDTGEIISREIKAFHTVENALEYITNKLCCAVEDFKPRKGLKYFNANLPPTV